MKKKNSRQQNVIKSSQQTYDRCKICSIPSIKSKINPLFQLNYELISQTINQTMQKPTYLSTINKILQRQPSKQSIYYRQVQKNLIFQQFIKQYFTIHKTNQKIQTLIVKNLPNVKANYMDFKIRNFLILNKYRVVNQRPNLPYPLCMQFQKQTDSKMSSTKSVQNKVLQDLEKEFQIKKGKKTMNAQQAKDLIKKINKCNRKSNQKFQIKALTKGIQQMIQNIKDGRALQNFKKQMEKSTQFKYGISKKDDSQSKNLKKIPQFKKSTDSKKNSLHFHQLKEKQFKRKVDNDMLKYFPDDKSKNSSSRKLLIPDKEYQLPLKKSSSKSKISFRSTQRLQTNSDNNFQQYGLSVIRQRRKKSKSRKKKSKSKQHSRKSKQSTQNCKLSKNKRLETQYVDSSTLRLHTGQSMLMKSKSSSRIPTQYDSGIIIKPRKSKSKSKYDHFLFTNIVKKQAKSSSISSQNGIGLHDFKKSKSKSKMKLLEFTSPSKLQIRK